LTISSLISSVNSNVSIAAILPAYHSYIHFSQPAGANIFPLNSISIEGSTFLIFLKLVSISSFSAKLAGFCVLHSQSFLNNLCQITKFKAGASIKGSTPIFINLETASIAVFVCKVESTKCQVNAAFIAIFAVSKSLISHTIIMSGSCLKIAFNHSA
jgi:hypothetical protein